MEYLSLNDFTVKNSKLNVLNFLNYDNAVLYYFATNFKIIRLTLFLLE